LVKEVLMSQQDPQVTWSEYYQRIRDRRVREAESLWGRMREAGVSEETVVAIDFVHFGNHREKVDALARQLSENYAVEVVPADRDYWYVKGTTRPDGVRLSQSEHAEWVVFMVDVARSYACVFSTWSLEVPSLGRKFNSEEEDGTAVDG
jgi:hypothetical protein